MSRIIRPRWFVSRSVLLTFGIYCTLSSGNVVYHQGLSGLGSLSSDPVSLVIVVLAPFYLAAIPAAAVAREMRVYDVGAWRSELSTLWKGIKWFFGIR